MIWTKQRYMTIRKITEYFEKYQKNISMNAFLKQQSGKKAKFLTFEVSKVFIYTYTKKR